MIGGSCDDGAEDTNGGTTKANTVAMSNAH